MGKVQAKHHHLRFNVVQCCIYFTSDQYTAMLHTSIGIGIARGQYYWILGALLGIVITLQDLFI